MIYVLWKEESSFFNNAAKIILFYDTFPLFKQEAHSSFYLNKCANSTNTFPEMKSNMVKKSGSGIKYIIIILIMMHSEFDKFYFQNDSMKLNDLGVVDY